MWTQVQPDGGTAALEERNVLPHEFCNSDDALLTTCAAAAYLGLSKAWLDRDRTRAVSLVPYIRVGERAVRYRLADLRAYVAKRAVRGWWP